MSVEKTKSLDESQLRARARAWRDADPDPSTRAEVDELLGKGDLDALAERFSGALEFGTAGLRGLLGAGPARMNRAVVRRTTLGLARYLKAEVPDVVQRGVVVGRDARRMSDVFALDVASVLAASGIPAWVFRAPVPTPLTAFATLQQRAAAGVMVTASHNPPEYNGYKVYWGNGAQIIPPHDAGIAKAIDEAGPANLIELCDEAAARERGLWRELPESLERDYLDWVGSLRRFRGPSPLRVVYTALHGVGGAWVTRALSDGGFSSVHPVAEQHEPDGLFPTVRFPNPEEPGALDLAARLAESERADLVLANDPDADRLAVMAREPDGALRLLTGNEVGVLLGHYLLTRGPLPQKPLVLSTIVSSPQLGAIAQALGVMHEATLTGFKWIANRALELESSSGATFVFGYEEALGYCVGARVRDKDGISAATVFADLAASVHAKGSSVLGYLEQIQREHGLFLAKQVNFTFAGMSGAQTIGEIMEGFREKPPARVGALTVESVRDYARGDTGFPPSNVLAFALEGGSRVTLRPSGTEPKIKYYFDVRVSPRSGESLAQTRRRGESELDELVSAFLVLARERGQPA